jgi:predicted SAM-dependent methyltransferase
MQIRPRKLELGCGMRPAPGYLHQDITAQEGVALDFTCNPWEIDLPRDSLDEVIALGIVEHLRFTEVDLTLRHVASLLAPGGAFLFDVPDMRVWSEYLYNITHGMSDKNPFTVEHVWSTIYGWQRWPGDEHKSGWTEASILAAVNRAGLHSEAKGPEIFTERGFVRGRFSRPADAHVYVRAEKRE